MALAIALQRYLSRYIEPELAAPPADRHWSEVVVVPCYDESPQWLQQPTPAVEDGGRTLLIVVLNRPEDDHSPLRHLSQHHLPQHNQSQCNQPLRSAIAALPCAGTLPTTAHYSLHRLNQRADILLYDMEQQRGPGPRKQGVGLARKAGCDLALSWIHRGAIRSDWICSTDADARLPADYFQRLRAVSPQHSAAVLPFCHVGGDSALRAASRLYELRLHHYVLGLEYAASPYAWHTLGSSLCVRPLAYTQVRGFPRRAGGEDFYLLNKLGKVGPVARLEGRCIQLQSRASHRVPFGTGPAVTRLLLEQDPASVAQFYHPACFEALRWWLLQLPTFWHDHSLRLQQLSQHSNRQQSLQVLASLGAEQAIEHCRRHSSGEAGFMRHFHLWFDAFRTLKFIHGLRAAGHADLSLAQLSLSEPQFWPLHGSAGVMLSGAMQHWGWLDCPD